VNLLAGETSPYLLQHARNPVDWYPWGPEALERARREDRPILLSIGYAACHWCHVMEHESFEDPDTAALMNQWFVNIKVDREERPDLDSIYMQAVQAMTGQGGWPMTVFLTPDGLPFYGGTYFPPAERHGMPSFKRVLAAIHDAYRSRRESVEATTSQLRTLFSAGGEAASGDAPDAGSLEGAYRSLARDFDMQLGGFGRAPKFPPSMSLDFLLRYWARTGTEFARDMSLRSFRAMARGGIYDQVGGGLARYSVDERWLVPHFEKMLYDNALFARLGVRLWQATGDEEARRVTRETLVWVEREMTSTEGGFYSSLDADSEGHEGRFYVWDDEEFSTLLGHDAPLLRDYWGVTPAGNFEGRNILHVGLEPSMVARRHGVSLDSLEEAVGRGRRVLYDERARRVWPGLDDKVIAAWNGLMLSAVAEAARVFDDEALHSLALRNGAFLRERLVRDGRVARSTRAGIVKDVGFLDDHAAVALAFLELHAMTLDRRWLADAMEIADRTVERFFDADRQLFFDTPNDHEELITRPRDITDNAMPSGTSLVADLLLRLSVITGEARGAQLAESILSGVSEAMARHPSAFGHLLGVADMAIHGATELVLVGRRGSAPLASLSRGVAGAFAPSLVLAGGEPDPSGPLALLRGRTAPEDGAMAYLCRGYACEAPTSDPLELGAQLAAVVSRG